MTAKEWITKRYGEPKVEIRQVYIATVPVMNGIAVGLGSGQEDASLNLISDLTTDGRIPIKAQQP